MKKNVALILVLFLFLIPLNACGSGTSESAKSDYNHYYDDYNYESSYYDDYYDDGYYSEVSDYADEKIISENYSVPSPVAETRKLVESADMTLETKEFDKIIAEIEKYVNNYGGYIEKSEINSNNYNYYYSSVQARTAFYKVRIPQSKFDDFVNDSKALGNVLKLVRSAIDVSASYTDTQAHLETLRIEQARLQKFMADSTNITEIIQLEERLSKVESEIEIMMSRIRNMDSQVSFSSVSVVINEVIEYTPDEPVIVEKNTFAQNIAEVFSASMTLTLQFLQGIVYVLVFISPLLVLVTIALIIFIIIRKIHKKK